jgi:hypothetical protein
MAKWRMGTEILYPLLPLCLLHLAWVLSGWMKVRRRWLAIPIAIALSAAMLAALYQKIDLVFDVFLWIWIAYLFAFVPYRVLRALVLGLCHVVRLPKTPPPA